TLPEALISGLQQGLPSALMCAALLVAQPRLVEAHAGSIPPSLKEVVVPMPPGVLDGGDPIVINKEKAIALGKALFWDMNVGSDGMACGSCHFHAGADSRSKNQFSPGKTHLPASPGNPSGFDPNDPRGANLSNYQLTKRDFPLYQFDPDTLAFRSDLYTYNAIASSGTFSGDFSGVSATGATQDTCTPFTGDKLDQTFHAGNIHTRRVEPRNTPTFVNVALFDRLFWDGRANNTYNGVSPWGPRDPDAHVWVADNGAIWKTRLAPLNEFEMACRGRTWKDIGRKLIKRHPLENQDVHAEDSVLANYRHDSGKGLNVTYEDLIKQAFSARFWSAGTHPMFGKASYDNQTFSQAEVNFSLFFGLAIQLYGSTLIANDTPFDRANIQPDEVNGGYIDQNGVLSEEQLRGFKAFNDAHCIFCHTGPAFSLATNRITTYTDGDMTERTMVKRFLGKDGARHMGDAGYMNNGAVPSEADPGLDNVDDYGKPFGFAPQYLASLAERTGSVYEPLPLVRACDIGFNSGNTSDLFSESEFGAGNLVPDPAGTENCAKPDYALVPGADIVAAALDSGTSTSLAPSGHIFKIPQLYNVELTGPYMHNGGMRNLDQVLDHYLRGGNFSPDNNTGHSNGEMDGAFIFGFDDSAETRSALIAFLKALTDERVRYERAPFDHPQVLVPNGHPGNTNSTTGSDADPLTAKDELLDVPAVGKNGRDAPLHTFEELLPD
ncbi:MAG: cytochrome peroxidase, partial [Proteobacteria bacterium]|nr:cytochrome peroxidase [Pseudomonadota bacterium]